MKNLLIALTAVLLCATNAYSNGLDTDQLISIINSNTSNDIKNIIGTPDRSSTQESQAMWNYKKKDYLLKFIWDVNTLEINNITVAFTDYQTTDWNSKNEKKIETGTTTMADIINLLGMPKDFKMHKDVQEAHYVYKNARVTLNFKDKKLTGYHILTN